MHDNGAFDKLSDARNGREYAANTSEAHTTHLVMYVYSSKGLYLPPKMEDIMQGIWPRRVEGCGVC